MCATCGEIEHTAQPDSVPPGGTVSLFIEVDDGDFPEDTVTCTLNCPHGIFSDTIVIFYDTIGKSVTWTAPDTLQDTVSYDTITVFASDIYEAEGYASTVIRVYESTVKPDNQVITKDKNQLMVVIP